MGHGATPHGGFPACSADSFQPQIFGTPGNKPEKICVGQTVVVKFGTSSVANFHSEYAWYRGRVDSVPLGEFPRIRFFDSFSDTPKKVSVGKIYLDCSVPNEVSCTDEGQDDDGMPPPLPDNSNMSDRMWWEQVAAAAKAGTRLPVGSRMRPSGVTYRQSPGPGPGRWECRDKIKGTCPGFRTVLEVGNIVHANAVAVGVIELALSPVSPHIRSASITKQSVHLVTPAVMATTAIWPQGRQLRQCPTTAAVPRTSLELRRPKGSRARASTGPM